MGGVRDISFVLNNIFMSASSASKLYIRRRRASDHPELHSAFIIIVLASNMKFSQSITALSAAAAVAFAAPLSERQALAITDGMSTAQPNTSIENSPLTQHNS
jgi:hypothetical protein